MYAKEIAGTFYHVWAGAAEGYYLATSVDAAADAFARDAGYQSEADMVAQINQPSEIHAALADGVVERDY